jgi:hypothetical protein
MADDAAKFELKYQYRWRHLPFIWVPLISALTVALAIVAIRRDSWQDGLVILAVGVAFALAASWLLFQGLADICITDQGVERRIGQWAWQNLRWSDVTRLTVMRSTNVETGRKGRSFALRGSKATPFFSRVIIFQERPGEMDELLAKFDACVSKHKISVRKL